MKRRATYSTEVRERAVRMVLTSEHEHSSSVGSADAQGKLMPGSFYLAPKEIVAFYHDVFTL